jgi:hypothetical protein
VTEADPEYQITLVSRGMEVTILCRASEFILQAARVVFKVGASRAQAACFPVKSISPHRSAIIPKTPKPNSLCYAPRARSAMFASRLTRNKPCKSIASHINFRCRSGSEE